MRYVPGQPPRKRRPWRPEDSFAYAGGEIRLPALPASAPLAAPAAPSEAFDEPRDATPPSTQLPRQPASAAASQPDQSSPHEPAPPETDETETVVLQTAQSQLPTAAPSVMTEPAGAAEWEEEEQLDIEAEIEAARAAREAAREQERAARLAELAAGRPPRQDPAEVVPVPALHGEGPRASLAAFTVSVARTAPSDAAAPDLARHARRCLICSHPDRDAIEADFLDWHSPKIIARDYDLHDGQSLYRHARATGLLHRRKNHVARVMERYLEKIDAYSTAEFDKVTRAVRVYTHIGDDGRWFEPTRTHCILTGRLEDLANIPDGPDPGSFQAPPPRRKARRASPPHRTVGKETPQPD